MFRSLNLRRRKSVEKQIDSRSGTLGLSKKSREIKGDVNITQNYVDNALEQRGRDLWVELVETLK